MTQDERLDFLIEAFKAESKEYEKLCVPADREGKRRFLRALMNVRMPGPMSAEVLAVQDAYLCERAEEKGSVGLDEIPVICEGLMRGGSNGGQGAALQCSGRRSPLICRPCSQYMSATRQRASQGRKATRTLRRG